MNPLRLTFVMKYVHFIFENSFKVIQILDENRRRGTSRVTPAPGRGDKSEKHPERGLRGGFFQNSKRGQTGRWIDNFGLD